MCRPAGMRFTCSRCRRATCTEHAGLTITQIHEALDAGRHRLSELVTEKRGISARRRIGRIFGASEHRAARLPDAAGRRAPQPVPAPKPRATSSALVPRAIAHLKDCKGPDQSDSAAPAIREQVQRARGRHYIVYGQGYLDHQSSDGACRLKSRWSYRDRNVR